MTKLRRGETHHGHRISHRDPGTGSGLQPSQAKRKLRLSVFSCSRTRRAHGETVGSSVPRETISEPAKIATPPLGSSKNTWTLDDLVIQLTDRILHRSPKQVEASQRPKRSSSPIHGTSHPAVGSQPPSHPGELNNLHGGW